MSLSIQKTSFAYSNSSGVALKDIACSFSRGRFYGIFGANGSGKSTLLKILSGDLKSTVPVMADGRILRSLSAGERAGILAFAAQENELILPFKVRECIKLGRYIRHDINDELIDRLMKDWQAEHLADKFFGELSGGEQQKVKLLRILAQDTPYILLDEPGSSLDWSQQLELYGKLKAIAHRENKCIIMVCHDIYTAPGFIDEMLLLNSGRIIYSGAPDVPAAAAAVANAFGRTFQVSRSSNCINISW